MAKAVVYQSKTGHTQRYAEMFAARTGMSCYEIGEASKHLNPGAEIIYFGWIMGGSVKGYKKAARCYDIKALAGVGMRFMSDVVANEIRQRYHTGELPVFYLMGGVAPERQGWLDRKITATAANELVKAAAKEDVSPDTIMVDGDFVLGKDYVSEQNLEQMLAWYQA